MPWIILAEGEPDIQRLEEAFKGVISRHESLRTSFHLDDGAPVQKIHREVPFALGFKDLSRGGGVEGEESVHALVREFVRPFDLTLAPLLRVQIVKTGESRYLGCWICITSSLTGDLSSPFFGIYGSLLGAGAAGTEDPVQGFPSVEAGQAGFR